MAKLDKWHYLKTRVSWIIVALLVGPMAIFAFWQPSQGAHAGVIFGVKISSDDFQAAYRQAQRQWEAQLRSLPESVRDRFNPSEEQLTRMAWDQLILIQETKRRRIRIGNQELLTALKQDPSFQSQGRFDRVLYVQVLLALNTSPEAYEQQLRNQLAVKMLIDGALSEVAVTDEELAIAYRTEHEGLRASLFVFPTERFTASVTLTDEEVKAHYDAHPELAQVPEQLSLEVIGASREDLMAQTTVEEAGVSAFNAAHPGQFATPEEARRALITRDVDRQLNAFAIDLEDGVNAKRAFEEIAARARLTPVSFGPMAAGETPASGGLDPAVLERARKLSAGEVSGLIETERGVWVVRVTQRQPSRLRPLEEVATTIREQLTIERAKAQAKDAASAWLANAKAQHAAGWRYEEVFATATDGVAPIASTLSRAGDIAPMGSNPAVNDAAFRAPLGELTEPLDAPRGYVVIRPEERLPADESKFSDAEPTLREALLTKKRNERFETWMADLRTHAKLKSVAATPLSPAR